MFEMYYQCARLDFDVAEFNSAIPKTNFEIVVVDFVYVVGQITIEQRS